MMADTTYYVNPEGASGDWGAGSNSNTGASKASPWKTLGKAINSQTVGDGFTADIIVRENTTVEDATEASVTFDDFATMNGRNFIFRTETPGDKFTIEPPFANVAYFAVSDSIVSGSIFLQDCIVDSTRMKWLFRMDTVSGMSCTAKDCNIAMTRADSSFYTADAFVVADRDLTIINSDITVDAPGILDATGEISIGDSCSITSTNGNVMVLNLSTEKLTIGSAILTAISSGGRGIFLNTTGTLDIFTAKGTTIRADSFGIHMQDGVDNYDMQGCDIESISGTAVFLGTETFKDKVSIKRLTIIDNVIKAISSGARGLMVQKDTTNFLIKDNTITGDSHALWVEGDTGEVTENIVEAITTIGFGAFGSNFSIHHNTIKTGGSTALITASGAIGTASKRKPASVNLNIYANICVSANGLGYWDYDETTGIAGQSGRGVDITLAETETATDLDLNGVMTGTGSAWDTAGANKVFVGSTVDITAGTAITPGTYTVVSVVSDTSLILDRTPGDYNPASADLAYTINRSDVMNDYQDNNCYWNESGPIAVTLGQKDNDQDCTTVAEIRTAWLTATAAGTPWNVNYATTNDINSLIEDPLLDDDLVPHNQNVIDAGMGAVQPAGIGGGFFVQGG